MVGRVLTATLYALGLCLFYLGAAPVVRWLGRKNPKVLLYHECAERESDYLAGLQSTTSPREFRAHVEYLARHYKIIPLQTLLSGEAPVNAVVITFDDGYASVYDNAFPVLKEHQVPATVYLISSVVDNHTLVWVNELNRLLRLGGAAAVKIAARQFDVPQGAGPAEIVDFCRVNYDPRKIDVVLGDLRQALGIPVQDHASQARLYLSWDQIAEMHQWGLEFGNHTRTHPNLERLSDEEQFQEIDLAQKELSKRLPDVRAFAHPFGHRGPRTAELVAAAGLSSAADVGGRNLPVKPLSVGRVNVANESVAGLFARMEVVEPMKARLRARVGVRSTSGLQTARNARQVDRTLQAADGGRRVTQ